MSVQVGSLPRAPDHLRGSRKTTVGATSVVVLLLGFAALVLMLLNRHNPVPRSSADLDQMLGQPVFTATKVLAAVLFAAGGWMP